MAFRIQDVLETLRVLADSDVDAVVVGGWGVDALIGEQTRTHDDLDVWVRIEHDGRLRDVLAAGGFLQEDGGVWQNYVLRDPEGRKLDVHLATFRPDGSAIYQMDGGGTYVVGADAFTIGSIGGSVVRCVTAEQQMVDHACGYEPDEEDRADMRALHERLGVSYLPPVG
jgi:lincosamide nucleotidyltransferase A/C/D/E